MHKFTVRAGIKTDKENAKGQCPVALFVSIAGKPSVVSLGFSVPRAMWDTAKGRLKTSAANAAVINTRIQQAQQKLERELHEHAEAGNMPERISKGKVAPAVDFYLYVETILEGMEAKGQKVTARRYRNNLPSIREYHAGKLSLQDITREWLKGYEDFCRKEYKNPRVKDPKRIAQNTIWSRFKMLRKVLLQAVEDKHIPACPLGKSRGGHPMPGFEKVPKDYLTFEEVCKLADLLGDSRLTEAEDMTLSYFLVECTAGIRHSDWSRFTVERLVDGQALKVIAKKTGQPVYVDIIPGSMLERALGHIKAKGYQYTATETARANTILRDISLISGIRKPMTTHTGRHTAATLLLEKGMSKEGVAGVLGVTMAVVDTYAKMTRLKSRNEMRKIGGI